MKKTILLLMIVCGSLSCKKDKSTPYGYPLTNLPGSTWKAFKFTAYDKSSVYTFVHFNSSTSATVYDASIDGSNVIITNTYRSEIASNSNHIDSFDLYDNSGKFIGGGFTTDDVNKITYADALNPQVTYSKVN